MAREFIVPGRMITGSGALDMAETALGSLGKKAMIVTDQVMIQLGNCAKVETALKNQGVDYTIFAGITGEPTDVMIHTGLKQYQDEHCDFLVALGGGSPIDSMKAIGSLVVNGGSINDYMGKVIDVKMPPMAAIPTTAGTGSEATQFTIITNTEKDIKMLLKGQVLMPTLAIIDPQFTMTAPPKITAATGLDVLAHSFDAMTSVKANPATDALALGAAKLAVKYLQRAVKDGQDKEARAGMSQASTIAGLAFSQTGTTGSHACSYILTSRYHVPHGEACAFTLDSWLLIDYAKELGFADVAELSDWINKLKKEFGMRTTLKEIGAGAEDLADIVDSSMASGNMTNNIAQIGREGVMTVFKAKL